MVRVPSGGVGVVASLLVSLALAGCTGGEAVQAGPASVVAAPAEVDETTGGIEGLVHDDGLLPIAGAQVALAETEFLATTDDTGRFTMSKVPPGDYQLFAQRIGYDSVGKRVTVTVATVAPIDITLVAIAVKEPWVALQSQRGIFGCGSSWRPADPVTGGGIAACGVLSLYGGNEDFDRFLIVWPLTGKKEEWKGVVFETEWTSNQVFSQGLWAIWEPNGCGIDFADPQGRSPLWARLDDVELEDVLDNDCAEEECTEEECALVSRMFSSPQSLGETYPADISITIQQVYTNHVSEFYNEPGPLEFSAIGDA